MNAFACRYKIDAFVKFRGTRIIFSDDQIYLIQIKLMESYVQCRKSDFSPQPFVLSNADGWRYEILLLPLP